MYDKSLGLTLDYHRSMLLDARRVEAFRTAIQATVRPGDVVLDIGCGTGVLSFFACQAGARKVIAIDSGEVIEVARELGRRNGFADRTLFLRQRSQDVELVEKADVLITETLGNGGFDEGILGTVLDARRRLLKPKARLIPNQIELHLCPLDVPGLRRDLNAWTPHLHGFDASSLRPLAANNLHWARLDADCMLSSDIGLGSTSLGQQTEATYRGQGQWIIERPGVLNALGGWFRCGDLQLDNGPQSTACSWQQVVLPFEQDLDVKADDRLHVQLDVEANGSLWHWRVEHQASNGGPQRRLHQCRLQQSTFLGTFLSSDSLRRQSRDFVPTLNLDGQIEQRVLQLMDGEHTLASIVEQVERSFPGRFEDPEQLARTVRSICGRFAADS